MQRPWVQSLGAQAKQSKALVGSMCGALSRSWASRLGSHTRVPGLLLPWSLVRALKDGVHPVCWGHRPGSGTETLQIWHEVPWSVSTSISLKFFADLWPDISLGSALCSSHQEEVAQVRRTDSSASRDVKGLAAWGFVVLTLELFFIF